MAEEGALAERALTTAWDAFEERFSWQSVADLRLLARFCPCSHVFASVLHLAEEEVHFGVFLALRAFKRQLLKRGWMRRKPRTLSVDSRGICYMEVVNNLDWLGSDSDSTDID